MRRIESFPWWWCYTHSNDREPTKSHFGQLHHAKITNSGTFIETFFFGLECLVATLFPSIIYCLTFSYILCPHLRFASPAPESREETTIEMWAGKKRAPMPFIQGTKNMEFSCSLHLLKATHRREGVRISSAMSRILNKYTNVLTFFGPNKIK